MIRRKHNIIKILKDYAIIYSTNGDEIFVDHEDVEKLSQYTWYSAKRKNTTYSMCWNGEKTIIMHRFVMNLDDDYVIDHKNHNGLDNRKENLRICTQSDNNKNTSPYKNNTSGCSGVCYSKAEKTWTARITVDKKVIFLKKTKNKEKAIQARKEAEIKYFGEYRYI